MSAPFALIKRLWRWLKGSSPPSKKEPADSEAEDAAAKPKSEAEELREAMTEMRQLLRQTGAGFAAAAGVILAGLGWTQIHQAFPLPELAGRKEWVLLGFLVGGAFAAFGGAAWFAGRFFAAQRRILLASKRSECGDLDSEDQRARDRVYQAHAEEETAASLNQVELRAYRLQRMARQLPPDDPMAKAWSAEAERLLGVVMIAIRRAGVSVLEVRSTTAFAGPGTIAAIALAVTGIVLVFGVADFAKGERDLIDLRAACQKAVNDGATDACDPVRSEASQTAVAAALAQKKREAEAALETLRGDLGPTEQARVRRLQACIALASAGDALAGAGEQLRAALLQACDRLLEG